MNMFGEKWSKGVVLDEVHFIVDGINTYRFPDDLDFIGEISNCDFFIDVFNSMILNRSNAMMDDMVDL
jgi:hypothetical protein